MFGRHLSNVVGKERLFYVWGQRGRESHGWLRYDQYIIDLTADQFDDQTRRVIVERTGESVWHRSFLPHREFAFDLNPEHELARYSDAVSAFVESTSSADKPPS